MFCKIFSTRVSLIYLKYKIGNDHLNKVEQKALHPMHDFAITATTLAPKFLAAQRGSARDASFVRGGADVTGSRPESFWAIRGLLARTALETLLPPPFVRCQVALKAACAHPKNRLPSRRDN